LAGTCKNKGSFSVDDIRLLHAAQQQVRNAFRSNASLASNDPAAISAIEHAESVAKILRENVVQGKHVGDNKYSEFIRRATGSDFLLSHL
jgi:complex III assembly factor LYRM7